MNPKVKNFLKFILFFVASIVLFWLVYKDQDWEDLYSVLKGNVSYTWVFISLVLNVLSNVSRAMRWQLLAKSMGYRISVANSFMGVTIGYFANLAIPRMGEFTRCGVISQYENVPFPKALGTVVTERLIDIIIMLMVTLLVIATQFKQVLKFLDNNQSIKDSLYSFLHSWWVLLLGFAVVVLIIGAWKLLKNSKWKQKIASFLQGLKEGILTIKNVKHRGLFIFHSFFIWLMYFLGFYICFFSFEFTSQLDIFVGLTVFTLGCFGMLAPVQGGIGAWHFMVIAGLMVYLPDVANIESLSKTFALLVHGSITALEILLGILCVIALPIYNARKKCPTS
ncbi:dolichol-P-glucose synthetase [Bacteroidia bacterium]|nr:dolichol-P-glucose synthetase [Bacteroidia bacterium]